MRVATKACTECGEPVPEGRLNKCSDACLVAGRKRTTEAKRARRSAQTPQDRKFALRAHVKAGGHASVYAWCFAVGMSHVHLYDLFRTGVTERTRATTVALLERLGVRRIFD